MHAILCSFFVLKRNYGKIDQGGKTMKQIMNYGYKHFTLENFPFDIKTRQSSNFPIDKHSHESLQICYVAKGSCKHIIYDYECILTKGDIFVVPLNTVHQLERVGAEEIVLIQVDFMPFMINENMTDNATWEYLFDFAYMQPFIFSVNQQMTKFNISSSNQKTIELLFSSMKNEFENQKEGFNISIKADLLKLLVILSREFKEPHNEKILNQSILYHKNILNDIIKYLEDNYAQDIKLEDIA